MRITVYANGEKHALEGQPGQNLAHLLVDNGFMEGIECGRGLCRKCAVRILSGDVVPASPDDDIRKGLADGYVLSCRSLLTDSDVDVEVSSGKDDIHRKARLPNLVKWSQGTSRGARKVFLKMTPPSLNDQASDVERVLAALGEQDVALRHGLLSALPSLLRSANFEATAVLIGNELVALEPGDTTQENFGFVVDIGTTTVAIYLVNLVTGDAIDAEGLANPQRAFGADVLSRISASAQPQDRQKLQNLVLEGIGEAFGRMLARNGVSPERVYSMIVVGNTTMSHLFLGVEPANLAVAPFIPCYRPRISLNAHHLDLPIHPQARIDVLANISGYVGSDTLGVAMATRPWELEGYSLAVDIGTNGEILLGAGDKIFACSAAAGPAFEGAHIEQGMRAGQGAIEKISLADGKVRLGIIGNTAPKGICGSGLIDGVAELLRTKLLDKTGRFAKEGSPAMDHPLASRLRQNEKGIREFVLAYKGELGNDQDIVITQKDIRELQLAKAAIAAGIAILYKEAGIDADKVDRVFLAGAFGNYLDRANAVALGVFPGIPVEKIIPVGNAAAEGAGICLLSLNELLASDRIAANIKPIELSTRMDFNELWIRCINFPELVC